MPASFIETLYSTHKSVITGNTRFKAVLNDSEDSDSLLLRGLVPMRGLVPN